ncbi:hypothetical protein F2Q69_00006485 [Brassica cretica]|uniref:Uncharacterized protein n=1 Tax=Brassica cretica TaxID=69181 RepID=A0A8S9PLP0_BRACR|nr:hypothetical protein F2Q69_00006485 [Brassica cretica]
MLCTESLLESMLRHVTPYQGYMSVILDVLTRVPCGCEFGVPWLCELLVIDCLGLGWREVVFVSLGPGSLSDISYGLSSVTLTGLSLARHVALLDHGVGLDGQSCSCLIVGWPVGLSSPTLGVGRPSVMFLFDCWPVGRPMSRAVQGCYRGTLWQVMTPEDQTIED